MEYGLIVTLIALALVGVLAAPQRSPKTSFTKIVTRLDAANASG